MRSSSAFSPLLMLIAVIVITQHFSIFQMVGTQDTGRVSASKPAWLCLPRVACVRATPLITITCLIFGNRISQNFLSRVGNKIPGAAYARRISRICN